MSKNTRLYQIVLAMAARGRCFLGCEQRLYNLFKAAKAFKVYEDTYSTKRLEFTNQGIFNTALQTALKPYNVTTSILSWAENITPEELELEFNSHEIMELLTLTPAVKDDNYEIV